MPLYELFIDGVYKDFRQPSLKVALVANGRDVWGCEIASVRRLYEPFVSRPALLKEDGNILVDGFVDGIDEKGAGDEPILDAVYSINFVSQESLAGRRIVNETFPIGTSFSTIVNTLVTNYLAVFGVSAGTIPSTPVLVEELKIKNKPLTEVFDTLSTWSGGFLWSIKQLVLNFTEPAITSSPFDIADSDSPANTFGQILKRTSQKDKKNTIIVSGGQPGFVDYYEQFTGDGSTTTFQLKYAIYGPIPPTLAPGLDGAVGYAVVDYGTYPSSTGTESLDGSASLIPGWNYDEVTHTVTRNLGPVPAGVDFFVRYQRETPIVVTAIDAADVALNGPNEVRLDYLDVIVEEELQRIADTELLRHQGNLEEVRYKTFNPGMRIGMVQSIQCADRDINGDYLIVEINGRSYEGKVEWSVRGIGGSKFRGSFRELYTLWLRFGSGSTSSSPISLPPSGQGSGPAPPIWSNQFNRNGAFGGNAAWTFVEPELLVRLVGPDAETMLRGQIGGLNYGVPALPAAVVTRIGSVSTTRLYLSSSAAGYSPPTFKGAWDDTSQVVTKKLVTTKADTAVSHAQASETSSNNQWDLLNYRGVSDPLTAQTIGGTLSAMIVAFAGAFANHEMYWHIHLYATVGDTDAVRHTFISDYRENSGTDTRFPNPVNWGGYPLGTDDPLTGIPDPISLTSGAIQTGDRLVIEIGVVARNSLTGSFTSSIGYGARADRSDASFRSAIDTSSWIDLNLSNPTSSQVTHAWMNNAAPLAEGDALTLENPDDGTAWFKNDKGIYINGLLFGGAGGTNFPAALLSPNGFVALTADPSSPDDPSWWVVIEGTTPNAVARLKYRFNGTTYTIISHGPV